MDCFTRRPHPDFHLRTDRHPLNEAAERRDEKRITFVTAVITHLVAEETARDADARWSEITGHDVIVDCCCVIVDSLANDDW